MISLNADGPSPLFYHENLKPAPFPHAENKTFLKVQELRWGMVVRGKAVQGQLEKTESHCQVRRTGGVELLTQPIPFC